MSERKHHCTRCNNKLEKSVVDSNNDKIVAYCLDTSHKPIRFHIFLGNARRTIRKERIRDNKKLDNEFNLSNLNCICGKKFYPDRGGISHTKGIKTGLCLDPNHRVELLIMSKIYPNEPRFYELQEISFKQLKK